ncbi:MAG TPA: YggS family pyridoxal phosphate-dependent enzyme [Bacteroidales bacterium]|nr:YggS family pyridoxal phosphate-dependent enzyme [Bacteroidales bacterium]
MNIVQNLKIIKESIGSDVQLVAVSKTKPPDMILEVYRSGHLDFGENKVQELLDKKESLPDDIRWHMIGHLQSNKVKYIAPFVYLVHSVDSQKILKTLNKEGGKNNRVIDCLLQVHIAKEDSKFGFDEEELKLLLDSGTFREMKYVRIRGVMGMATFTDDFELVRTEFRDLKRIFDQLKEDYFSDQSGFSILSMGMSGDYIVALEEGSNMVRIGSQIFGERNYNK